MAKHTQQKTERILRLALQCRLAPFLCRLRPFKSPGRENCPPGGFFRYRGKFKGLWRKEAQRSDEKDTAVKHRGAGKGHRGAKNTRDFNYINDLKMLRKQYTCTSKRDYLKLLDLLVDKYSVEETAAVHAALLKKVQAGDLDAIRLWNEMSKENRDAGEGVQIIDDIKVK